MPNSPHPLQTFAQFEHSIADSVRTSGVIAVTVLSESAGTRRIGSPVGTERSLPGRFWGSRFFSHATRWRRYFRLFPRRLQLPIPVGLNLLLMPGVHG
jgi:hypothetical protein